MCSLAKSEEKRKKTLCIPCTDQKPFCPFLENKRKYLTKFYFQFYFCQMFFDVHINKVPAIIFKLTLCCACTARTFGQVPLFFGIGLIKIFLIGSIVPIFENRKKYYISLHLNRYTLFRQNKLFPTISHAVLKIWRMRTIFFYNENANVKCVSALDRHSCDRKYNVCYINWNC